MSNGQDQQPHPCIGPGAYATESHATVSRVYRSLEAEGGGISSLYQGTDPSYGALARDCLLSGHAGEVSDAQEDSPLSCSGLLMGEYQGSLAQWRQEHLGLDGLPNELLLHILGFLDVCDLLATSRTSHHLRSLSLAPILHRYRLRRTRVILPPLLYSPARPSLADLMRRSIFLTHTTVVSRRLGRSLAAIRLSHRLAARLPASALIERCVLPPECAPGTGHVAPAIVARKRAVEKERVKDGLRRWVDVVWRGEVRQRSEGVRRWEERVGVGRVWRLRKFWERVASQG